MTRLTTVYLLQSESHTSQHYVGLTLDLSRRVKCHNAGESPHTAKYRPWRLVLRIDFSSEQRARDFEKYLKSGSGRAFMVRHFL
jgi:putative endonuclease